MSYCNRKVGQHCVSALNSRRGFAGLNDYAPGEALRRLPKGDIPLRALRWTLPLAAARLTFQAKLMSVEGLGTTAASPESAGPVDPFNRGTIPIDRQVVSDFSILNYSFLYR